MALSVENRAYIARVIAYLSQPAWMTTSDVQVVELIAGLVREHDKVEQELKELKAKQREFAIPS